MDVRVLAFDAKNGFYEVDPPSVTDPELELEPPNMRFGYTECGKFSGFEVYRKDEASFRYLCEFDNPTSDGLCGVSNLFGLVLVKKEADLMELFCKMASFFAAIRLDSFMEGLWGVEEDRLGQSLHSQLLNMLRQVRDGR